MHGSGLVGGGREVVAEGGAKGELVSRLHAGLVHERRPRLVLAHRQKGGERLRFGARLRRLGLGGGDPLALLRFPRLRSRAPLLGLFPCRARGLPTPLRRLFRRRRAGLGVVGAVGGERFAFRRDALGALAEPRGEGGKLLDVSVEAVAASHGLGNPLG